VADLRGDAASALIELTIHDKRAADAAAGIAVEDHPPCAARAETCLSQPRQIRVIAQDGLQARFPGKPSRQRKVAPAFHLMADDRASGRSVHRSAEANPHLLNLILFCQATNYRPENLQDVGGLRSRRHLQALEFGQRWPVARADPDLKFGPPDLHCQIHTAFRSR